MKERKRRKRRYITIGYLSGAFVHLVGLYLLFLHEFPKINCEVVLGFGWLLWNIGIVEICVFGYLFYSDAERSNTKDEDIKQLADELPEL